MRLGQEERSLSERDFLGGCAAQTEIDRRDTMSDSALREHVVNLLLGKGAHVEFDRVFDGIPYSVQGVRPEGASHTPWEILEHMRIVQRDILEFSRNPDHISPEWPDGYWPEFDSPPIESLWKRQVDLFRDDLKAMIKLVKHPSSDLFTPFHYGRGQTLLREALLVADHNAYHLGELVVVRRLLGTWE